MQSKNSLWPKQFALTVLHIIAAAPLQKASAVYSVLNNFSRKIHLFTVYVSQLNRPKN